jgi:hypothetical protein
MALLDRAIQQARVHAPVKFASKSKQSAGAGETTRG